MEDVLLEYFENIFERTITSFKSEVARIIEKSNGRKFNIWKLKIKRLLAFVDLWDILDGSKKAPPSNADSKVLKKYQRRVKNSMSIIGVNLADNQFAHFKSYKGLVKA